jgi:decaprenyl-phosphate phosphoribosyltransferase
VITAVVRSLRPRQWTKNLLVAAAPLAAGRLFDAPVWWQTLVAFVAFCGLSGAAYLVNDAIDVESDRAHPRKRQRPIAAGDLPVRTALVVATVLGVAAIAAGTAVDRHLGILLLAYAALQVAYSVWLKHEPVLDLAVVSVGFLMRAVSGGLAAGLALSDFFLMVAGFGSLFMVGRQAVLRAPCARQRGRHPTFAGALHRQLPPVRVEHRGHLDRAGLLPMGLRAGR